MALEGKQKYDDIDSLFSGCRDLAKRRKGLKHRDADVIEVKLNDVGGIAGLARFE